jgi:uracil-DNA glycosylase
MKSSSIWDQSIQISYSVSGAKFAQGKDKFIPAKNHLILKAAHPSPLGANKGGWWGCKHFSKANQYLEKHGKASIEWRIT